MTRIGQRKSTHVGFAVVVATLAVLSGVGLPSPAPAILWLCLAPLTLAWLIVGVLATRDRGSR